MSTSLIKESKMKFSAEGQVDKSDTECKHTDVKKTVFETVSLTPNTCLLFFLASSTTGSPHY